MGARIDLSQIEALAWQMPGAFADWTMNGRAPGRTGDAVNALLAAVGDNFRILVAWPAALLCALQTQGCSTLLAGLN